MIIFYTNQPIAQVAAVYHKKIGDVTVTVISDGDIQLSFWPYYELNEEVGSAILDTNFEISPPILNTNCFIINIQGRLTLIDTGIGMGIGQALRNMKAAGYTIEDIETILLTHLHPDHSNGLIHTDGAKAFPNANIVVNDIEYAYWMDNRNMQNKKKN